MTTFEKKTVLITGGTSGIGKATALAFAKEGANVVVSGLRVAEGEQVAREITSTGRRALFVQTDVIREDAASSSLASSASAPSVSTQQMGTCRKLERSAAKFLILRRPPARGFAALLPTLACFPSSLSARSPDGGLRP